ncbi:aldehyde dehydrogenase family protein [Aeromicrobium sp. A1-2]|uniref:aldehyde dehydrogenase family protein n=1 Tax=Aeromicrobium sp. A1-2 TaxID=2107713 RepID=UPI0020B17641|nr:aldehyde dehydrogenase family protein [Aeromicrobium sp. A1-2]
MNLKPAALTPLTAIRLGELGLEAGLPEGVFTVIPGRGSVVSGSPGDVDGARQRTATFPRVATCLVGGGPYGDDHDVGNEGAPQ